MKISDGQAVGAYQQQGSCEKAAVVLGVNAETIRLRLIRAGIPRPRKHRPFSVAEIEQIRAEYAVYRNAGRIKDFAHRLGRTPQALQGQASKLGLGSRDFSGRLWPVGKHMSAEAARVLFESFLAARVPVAKFCARAREGRTGRARSSGAGSPPGCQERTSDLGGQSGVGHDQRPIGGERAAGGHGHDGRLIHILQSASHDFRSAGGFMVHKDNEWPIPALSIS